jgi:SSS family solute:Na+ symporter
MIPAAVVVLYLATVLYVGLFAFRRFAGGAEDYFLAGRSLGQAVFLLSLFGTNMTAFSILGSSGHAFSNGIVTFGLMASSSALVIPVGLFFIGTRLWALGKKYGFITPVQMFRDRWECGHIGTAIFAVQAALLVPYIVIGVIGGGTTLNAISGGFVPYWLGGGIVALVVMGYVFFGGMRGTAYVNALQTTLFLCFGAVALVVIGAGMGGFSAAIRAMLDTPGQSDLLTRARVSPWYFFSYTFIPLSSLVFPHISIFCLTAKRMQHFKKTVIFYPICMLLIWLPAVFLGVVANRAGEVPAIGSKLEARATLNAGVPLTDAERTALRRRAGGDDVILRMLDYYAPIWLAGVLGAAVMAAVMASDSQILALSTMFTEDVFVFYEGKARFGEAAQVHTGRLFVVILTVAAYVIALNPPQTIFDLAVQYGFSGYSALFPLVVGALFWRRSTKWGALAVTLWTAVAIVTIGVLQVTVPAPAPGAPLALWSVAGIDLVTRTASGTEMFGLLPVVPLTVISALLMIGVSLATPPPSRATVDRYFAETR